MKDAGLLDASTVVEVDGVDEAGPQTME